MTAADVVTMLVLACLPMLVAAHIVQRRDLVALRRRLDGIVAARADERAEAEQWRGGVHRRIDALSQEVDRRQPPAKVPPLPVPDVAGPPSEPPARGRTFAGVGPGRTVSYRGGACPSPLPPTNTTTRP